MFGSACPLLESYGLIYQHDGDIVFDGIHQLAGVADEPLLAFVQADVTFALGARKNRRKLWINQFSISRLEPLLDVVVLE